jgi:aryl-alcohol dehydrogenase-like predicted oxidoreductase
VHEVEKHPSTTNRHLTMSYFLRVESIGCSWRILNPEAKIVFLTCNNNTIYSHTNMRRQRRIGNNLRQGRSPRKRSILRSGKGGGCPRFAAMVVLGVLLSNPMFDRTTKIGVGPLIMTTEAATAAAPASSSFIVIPVVSLARSRRCDTMMMSLRATSSTPRLVDVRENESNERTKRRKVSANSESDFWCQSDIDDDGEGGDDWESSQRRQHQQRHGVNSKTNVDSSGKKPSLRPKLPPVPSERKLDLDGTLPPGSYLPTAPKETCRLQIAWDLHSSSPSSSSPISGDDVSEMVQRMQRSIDSGLSTFQIVQRNTEQSFPVYRALIADTPGTVLDGCHFTVPLSLRETRVDPETNRLSIRKAVVGICDQMGSDCVDDLQIQFLSSSSTSSVNDDDYYLDLLDGLRELQRDGLVGSLSARNLSPQLWFKIQHVGMGHLLSTNQVAANLLDPTLAMMQKHQFDGKALHTVVESPLAGGWLTDRFGVLDYKKQVPTARWFSQLSPKEREIWQTAIVHGVWSAKHLCDDPSHKKKDFPYFWRAYQSKLMMPVRDIANKHRVSMASVVLRWTLRLENVASTVVGCRLLPGHHYWDINRPVHPGTLNRNQSLRQVFQFDLDDDDMEILSEISGFREQESREAYDEAELYNADRDGPMRSTLSGLFIPGWP